MTKWIMVVDDDTANLQMAGHILSKNNMRATALKSGKALIEYISSKGTPDLILLDIKMPVMDGFETLRHLRETELENGYEKTPVIFLTADEDSDTEMRGFEVGVSDFIRKPFNPDVLLKRIENVFTHSREVQTLKSEANTDKLTGFLNKAASSTEFSKVCSSETGCLLMIDLDSFKLVNDIYGHEMGDRVLHAFSGIIREVVPDGSRCGRIGGDEFAIFCPGLRTEDQVSEMTELLNYKLLKESRELMVDDMELPLGVSVGAVMVPKHGNDYLSLLKLADKSLYSVKKLGRHGYCLYSSSTISDEELGAEADISKLSEILGERSVPNVALQLDRESFASVYRYIIRYTIRNNIHACKVLFTLHAPSGKSEDSLTELFDEFGNHIRQSLRKSDILMRNRRNQYFVFLTDIREDSVDKVVNNLIDKWHAAYKDELSITYETEFVKGMSGFGDWDKPKHIIIVDDDSTNLTVAGRILGSDGLKVTPLKSGQALLDYLDSGRELPDLILLDVMMPGMDGYETLRRMRSREREVASLPVIFLTADESHDAESKGLKLGAMDFIRKPFVPEVLLIRVNHIIELVTLQKQLSHEVELKTRENRNLLLHVVESLATAIDTKDIYTKGHSSRVAEYSREIARRSGLSEEHQDEIYMSALLHDVGKIGIPITVLNKPEKLTDEEFELIKTHPSMGASILENIKEDPALALGAKYHHERYDGTGYPSGLSGKEIPESARIIAVADAYDAMSSKRSYRKMLSQEHIISEIEKGKGTQFDPVFADIMLSIIEEDSGYKLKED